MTFRVSLKIILSFFFLSGTKPFYAQQPYKFTLTTNKEFCLKGSAALEISGTNPVDTITIKWSDGSRNVNQIYELAGGDYSVFVRIKHHDSLTVIKDTTFFFSIDKEVCAVSIDKYFSPNDDNYHDLMGVYNAQYHPNFELTIFNKWGQQVHTQKNSYIPWDGKWNGIALPDGTYFYVFFYDSSDKTKLVKGDVTILR
ncbi:hypothetical protein CNR22_06595 [Sphingobacteriaceae bacterium]|nr:hypothetical protein CNR22_06595 [Sphingobacteriaceae bacterium]